MSSSTIHLNITTPEGVIYDDDIKEATIPGQGGEFGVLPQHADTMSLLKAGVIEFVDKDNKKNMVAVDWGYAKVNETDIIILADGAVSIMGDKIAEKLKKAEELLERASPDNISYTMSKMKGIK